MKTKLMCMVFIHALAFNLSACGNRQEHINSYETGIAPGASESEKDDPSENKKKETSGNEKKETSENEKKETSENEKKETSENHTISTVGTVDSSAFSGKVSGCYYADENKIIAAADKLYLYDTQKGKCIADVDISMQDLYVQTCWNGYFIVGQENSGSGNGSFMESQNSGGITGYLLDKNFSIKSRISLSGLLSGDSVLGTAAAAISQDGKQIAFGGLQGLYLYDIPAGKFSTILNYFEDGAANNMQLITMDSLAFTEENTLVYAGIGTDSSDNNGDGVSVYGTVSVDSGRLVITRKGDYKVEEIQKSEELLFMPQSFDKNNGTLLMIDTASNTEKTMTFSSSSEGKDGVFGSQQGKYAATAVLEGSSVTINIYDTASGKVIHTETVEDSNSTYFLRIPQILILDRSNTCIVVLGRGISEVNTLITTFGFEG